MGDRACVIFFDRDRVSATVYLHWHGSAVPVWIDQLKSRMAGRYGDAPYAAARFAGICHEHISGNLSLGISSNNLTHADLASADRMESESPGNAGIVVVDTSDFRWKAHGGYLAAPNRTDHDGGSPIQPNIERNPTMNNALRSNRFEVSLLSLRDEYDDDILTTLIDLLADAMHWCHDKDHDFQNLLRIAGEHFAAETIS